MVQAKFFRSKKLVIFNIILLSMMLGFGIGVFFLVNVSNTKTQIFADYPSASLEIPSGLSEMQDAFRAVAKLVFPSVVKVIVESNLSEVEPGFLFPFNFPFQNKPNDKKKSPDKAPKGETFGSGIIVHIQADKIYVLTNQHVIDNADKIFVKTYDETTYEATLVNDGGMRRDVALLVFQADSSKAKNFLVAKKGNSDDLQAGDIVFAIGHPFGLDYSITQGIVSAINRKKSPNVLSVDSYIQTDASINKGNSGGSLVNIKGELVGINTWIASPSGASAGLGFAIPINNIDKAINDILTYGSIRDGWIGVVLSDIDGSNFDERITSPSSLEGILIKEKKALRKSLKLPLDVKGVLFSSIFKEGPADKGGLLPGDFITDIDGKAIGNTRDIMQMVSNISPGEEAVLSIIRQGKKEKKKVTSALRAKEKDLYKMKSWPGLNVFPSTKQICEYFDINPQKAQQGVVVTYARDASSIAVIAGLKDGDMITAINGKNISTMSDFYQYLNEGIPEVKFSFLRKGVELSVTISR